MGRGAIVFLLLILVISTVEVGGTFVFVGAAMLTTH